MQKHKTSDRGLDLIVEFEGEILHVYDDGFGYPTAGVGHLLSASEKRAMPVGTKITRQQSRAFLQQDLGTAEAEVNKAVKVPISQNQFDALVSLTFNIGVAGFEHSSVCRLLNLGKSREAAEAILKWNKAKGAVVAGLTRRRQAERKLFLSPAGHAVALTGEPVSEPEDLKPLEVPTLVSSDPEAPGIENPVANAPGSDPEPTLYESATAKFDRVNNVLTGVTTRADSVKAARATFGGVVKQVLWAVFAFLIGMPWYIWLGVAVLTALFVLAYIHRQTVMGKIRELRSGGGIQPEPTNVTATSEVIVK